MIARELHGDVAVLRMQHGKANALDVELCAGLRAALEAERSSGARALVLVGSGSIFSAGVDLPRLLAGGPDYLAEFLPALSAVLLELVSLPLPVVSALNGHAIAGGCVLACASDRRLMSSADQLCPRIGAPDLSVGVPFPLLAFECLALAASRELLGELVVGGTLLTAKEALARGLVHKLAPPEELEAEAVVEAERLARIPSVSFAIAKRQLTAPLLERWEREGVAAEAEALEAWCSAPVLAAVRAFVERTLG
ncbi:MAG: enoyl-CoA hydratase/isomerase family protein [Planctomycetota bacterium]|nr:enoyl-CoA hydratase/isomerase family protein [Planctomycetota bacterium]